MRTARIPVTMYLQPPSRDPYPGAYPDPKKGRIGHGQGRIGRDPRDPLSLSTAERQQHEHRGGGRQAAPGPQPTGDATPLTDRETELLRALAGAAGDYRGMTSGFRGSTQMLR